MSSPRLLTHTRNGLWLLVVMGILTTGTVGYGDGPTGLDLNPSFMVGDWLAGALALTSVEDPEVTADPVALGGGLHTFGPTLWALYGDRGGVRPIQQYIPGALTADGPSVGFTQELPITYESIGRWKRVGESVILVGESEFDFNLDGTTEPATLRHVPIPS